MNFHARLAIVAKLSFSPYLSNSPVSPTFMGPLIALCFALLANVAKLSFLPYLPNLPVSPTFMGSLIALCFVLCLVGDCGNIVIFVIFAKFARIANFYGPPHCFVLCHVGDSGKIVIFAIFAKCASIANFYGPPLLLCGLPCWRFWQNCHFCHICQIRHYVLFFAIFVVACISGHISKKSLRTPHHRKKSRRNTVTIAHREI